MSLLSALSRVGNWAKEHTFISGFKNPEEFADSDLSNSFQVSGEEASDSKKQADWTGRFCQSGKIVVFRLVLPKNMIVYVPSSFGKKFDLICSV